jgi:putative radical SAM enzyme (TIGR03279 family)
MDKKRSKTIASVVPGSIAEEAGIEPGDVLLTIDGKNVRDIFDYKLSIMREELVIGMEKPNGETWEIEVEKDANEDLGIEFENPMADEERACSNRCIFCFIDQLPPGMRSTLYFKDDDARLSFIYGNYVTLTNMSDRELERIISYRLSPVNVSVHTTNPELRKFMLGNPKAGNVLERIKCLINSGLSVNCQVVLCRGINDGAELDRTLNDLIPLHPGMVSISVVPVGLTRFRDGLYPLEAYDRHSSVEIISSIRRYQRDCLAKYGSRIVFPADEFYLKACMEIPEHVEYEDYPQIENGVGMLALFKYEFLNGLKVYEKNPRIRIKERKVSIATGTLARDFVDGLVRSLTVRYNSLQVNVYGIRNKFFGEDVSVSGLVTGQDLVDCLKGKNLGEELFIPRNMLKADELLFLDDYNIDMVQDELGVTVTPVEVSGLALVESLTGVEIKERFGGERYGQAYSSHSRKT